MDCFGTINLRGFAVQVDFHWVVTKIKNNSATFLQIEYEESPDIVVFLFATILPVSLGIPFFTICVTFGGKEDEFPKKLGKIPADSQPAMLNLTHLVNGQKNNSVPKARASQGTREGRQEGSPRRYGEGGQESSPTARTKRDREGSPTPRAERGRESSPNRQRRKNSLEKRPTLRHQQKPVTLNTQSGLPKNDGENPRRKPEGQAEADPKQKHNATANQNSNAVLTTGKEFVPRWIKPSDVKIIEKTTKITMEFKTRSPKQSWTGTGPAPEDEAQLFNLKQKVRVWDVDESKRGSNASQYDNVPEADLENGNLMEQVPERVFVPSPRSTAFSSGSRKEIEKGSSPPKISNSYAFSSQPRVLRYSSQSDGSVVGPHMRQPPPSYNNPPVYQGYSPKHVTKVGNFTATQYNHGTRTSSATQLYIPDFLQRWKLIRCSLRSRLEITLSSTRISL
ncbi:hypothetical protein E2320_004348 [Naja naja]|nr:hypothetical protein E2320_004348 [Naja naja]